MSNARLIAPRQPAIGQNADRVDKLEEMPRSAAVRSALPNALPVG
jgi:hypothetical protein